MTDVEACRKKEASALTKIKNYGTESIDKYEKEIENLRRQFHNDADLSEQAEKRITELKGENKELKAKVQKMQKDKTCKEENAMLKQKLETSEREAQLLNLQLEKQRLENEHRLKVLRDEQTMLAVTSEKQVKAAEEDRRNADKRSEEAQKQVEDTRRQAKDIQKQTEDAQKQTNDARTQVASLTKDYETLQTSYADMEKAKSAEVEELKTSVHKLKNAVKSLADDL